ncbi:MAG: T9SS type A sorting domain-containing protein [Salibacteraceae bacterium]
MIRFLLFFLLPLPGLLFAQSSPDPPILQLSANGTSISITLSNPPTSNNYQQQYTYLDPTIPVPDSVGGVPLSASEKAEFASFHFQGYLIYQFANATILPNRLDDPLVVRLAGQSDLADQTTHLSNYTSIGGQCIPTLMLQANNTGLEPQLTLLTDQFSGQNLEIGKTYCYQARAYAYNPNKTVDNCSQGALFLVTDPASIPDQPVCITLYPVSIGKNGKAESDLSIAADVENRRAMVTSSLPGKVTVIDITGKLIQELTLVANEALYTKPLGSGLYMIRFDAADDGAITKKLLLP